MSSGRSRSRAHPARPSGPAFRRGQNGNAALSTTNEANTRAALSSSRLVATESPLIVTGAQASAGMQVSLTAVGMVSSPAARRIQVTYDDGRLATIPLH